MKKLIFLSVALLIGFVAFSSYEVSVKPARAETKIKSFFAHLSKQEYNQAFHYVKYFDSYANLPAKISEEAAQKIWVDRVEKLQKQGTYVKELVDVTVQRHDTCCVSAYVSFVVMNNGKETVFSRGINFDDKIINFVPGEPELTALDEALSGSMREETGFRE